MPLSLLDERVRSKLRSGVAITSVAQCVGELVENAIDAEAKCIAVRADISKYKIQVNERLLLESLIMTIIFPPYFSPPKLCVHTPQS